MIQTSRCGNNLVAFGDKSAAGLQACRTAGPPRDADAEQATPYRWYSRPSGRSQELLMKQLEQVELE